ncbi:MAG: hypothetical protein E7Z87_01330 [Cyanobacteria bacterium SIG26]|nr:hypothetical protein [Cyanobacteria bacterium SIG26]
MRNKFSLLLAAVMVINTVASVALGAFVNPLKNYNLYEDVNPSSSDERERVLGEYLKPQKRAEINAPQVDAPSINNFSDVDTPEAPKSRNQTLRDSSLKVFSDPSSTPAWTEGPSFYPNASFASIVEKYKNQDYSGCMQECTSYVRQHPNDTLGYYYLAMCYAKVNDMHNAIKAYEKVIAINDNPMIVKYATNGRNCIMGNENEKCYPNVNEPELVYPYANIPVADLQYVNPDDLVNKNLARLYEELNKEQEKTQNNKITLGKNKDNKKEESKVVLPFGKQDAELDAFINAPYGNGLSPDLNNQYKQLQLKKIKSTINIGDYSQEDEQQNMKDIQEFDNQKTDAETIKLAYVASEQDWKNLEKDPEFIKMKEEYEGLSALLNSDNSKDKSNNIMDMLPYMTEEKAKNMSPEMIQNMMLNSLMGDLNL